MASIRCTHGGTAHTHETVSQVRACQSTPVTPVAPASPVNAMAQFGRDLHAGRVGRKSRNAAEALGIVVASGKADAEGDDTAASDSLSRLSQAELEWERAVQEREAAQERAAYAAKMERDEQARKGTTAHARSFQAKASEKQVDWLRSMVAEKDTTGIDAAWLADLVEKLGEGTEWTLTKVDASPAIDQLRYLKKAAKVTTTVTEDGIYLDPTTEKIYKAQFNKVQGSGRALYAKVLVIDKAWKRDDHGTVLENGEAHFEYASGAISKLKPEWKLSKEDAARYGALYGVCVRCGSPLTKESSIAQGMGDWCASKY